MNLDPNNESYQSNSSEMPLNKSSYDPRNDISENPCILPDESFTIEGGSEASNKPSNDNIKHKNYERFSDTNTQYSSHNDIKTEYIIDPNKNILLEESGSNPPSSNSEKDTELKTELKKRIAKLEKQNEELKKQLAATSMITSSLPLNTSEYNGLITKLERNKQERQRNKQWATCCCTASCLLCVTGSVLTSISIMEPTVSTSLMLANLKIGTFGVSSLTQLGNFCLKYSNSKLAVEAGKHKASISELGHQIPQHLLNDPTEFSFLHQLSSKCSKLCP